MTDENAEMQLSDITFDQFCCSAEHMPSTVKNAHEQLFMLMKKCFNTSANGQYDILLLLYDENRTQFRETDCSHVCNAKTTVLHISYMVFLVVLLVLILTSNLVVIAAIQKVSFLKKNFANLFITSLALSDLLVGLIIIPNRLVYTYNNLKYCSSLIACRMYLSADISLFSVSITNLLIITIDRFIAINKPYKHSSYLSLNKTRVIVLLVWLYGITWGLLGNVKWDEPLKESVQIDNFVCKYNNSVYTVTVMTCVFIIPSVLMAIVYFKILGIAILHAKQISNTTGSFMKCNSSASSSLRSNHIIKTKKLCNISENNNSRMPENKSRYMNKMKIPTLQLNCYHQMILKASKTVAIVYGTFLICWLPLNTLILTEAVCKTCLVNVELNWAHVVFAEILPLVNSTMNPFIYVISNKQYRKAFNRFRGRQPSNANEIALKSRAGTAVSTLNV